ncbi:ParM/StbA family protein (plasmid) [Bacillus thuringiensis]|uniref:ParM/StbA family protein n=1 Tax=Bacillus thuringiensis TaxID=1428 RepID=UPI003D70FFEE
MAVDYIGVEASNSFVKVATVDETLCYLNTLRRVEPFEDTTGLTVYTYEGVRYFIGEEQGVSSSARNDDRYSSAGYRTETILALAHVVKDGSEVVVGTGLPSEDYKNEENHEKVKRNLVGEHTVQINGKTKTFNIVRVYTPMQPIGSVVNRIYDYNMKVRKGMEWEKDARKLVIDIGFGTTDVCEAKGLRIVRYDGVQVGMMEANRIIKDELTKRGARGIVSFLHMDTLLRNAKREYIKDEFTEKEVLSKVIIETGGKEYEIKDLMEQALEYTTRAVMQRVEMLGYVMKDFDVVLFTGGSLLALHEYIKPYLTGVNTKAEQGAQTANAKGYAKYAMIQDAKVGV